MILPPKTDIKNQKSRRFSGLFKRMGWEGVIESGRGKGGGISQGLERDGQGWEVFIGEFTKWHVKKPGTNLRSHNPVGREGERGGDNGNLQGEEQGEGYRRYNLFGFGKRGSKGSKYNKGVGEKSPEKVCWKTGKNLIKFGGGKVG